jgi:hypothetical protein
VRFGSLSVISIVISAMLVHPAQHPTNAQVSLDVFPPLPELDVSLRENDGLKI